MIAQKDTSAPDLTIKVTGYQWKWGYDYLKGEGEGISFVSTLATPRDQIEGKAPKGENYLLEVDNEMVVPVGKKVRVITTAADVIHAWWIPAFGAKQDAIPGFLRDIVVPRRARPAPSAASAPSSAARSTASCRSWCAWCRRTTIRSGWASRRRRWRPPPTIRPRPGTLKELVARGEKVYAANCVACHQAQGRARRR